MAHKIRILGRKAKVLGQAKRMSNLRVRRQRDERQSGC